MVTLPSQGSTPYLFMLLPTGSSLLVKWKRSGWSQHLPFIYLPVITTHQPPFPEGLRGRRILEGAVLSSVSHCMRAVLEPQKTSKLTPQEDCVSSQRRNWCRGIKGLVLLTQLLSRLGTKTRASAPSLFLPLESAPVLLVFWA